jgi:hypothetical protein
MTQNKEIIYIGEVPVEPIPGGGLLLYRAFNLVGLNPKIIYFNHGVGSDTVTRSDYFFLRLRNTRFSKLYNTLNFHFFWFFNYLQLKDQVKGYSKIVSVSHGVGFKIAYKLAVKYNIPLVTIHHDLFEKTFDAYGIDYQKKWFLKPAKYSTNLYVSTYMQELINEPGHLLLPFRDAGNEQLAHLTRVESNRKNMVYAGSVHTASYIPIINDLSIELSKIGWDLILFSNLKDQDFDFLNDQKASNLVLNGFISNTELKNYIVQNADAMLLIQSFEKEHEVEQSTNFPSKLTDYTLPGVPIVFIGPDYASGVKWYHSLNSDIGICLNSGAREVINKELIPFLMDAEKVKITGANAKRIGDEYFEAANFKSTLESVFFNS